MAGSEAQITFFEQTATDLANALEITRHDVEIIGIEAQDSGRRQMQSATSARVDFAILSPDAASVMQELTAQVLDPTSTLRTSEGPLSSVNPDILPVFGIQCFTLWLQTHR
eukprot:SAG22_NODE_111_length_19607_cov_12.696637_17_plen_111_part_00